MPNDKLAYRIEYLVNQRASVSNSMLTATFDNVIAAARAAQTKLSLLTAAQAALDQRLETLSAIISEIREAVNDLEAALPAIRQHHEVESKKWTRMSEELVSLIPTFAFRAEDLRALGSPRLSIEPLELSLFTNKQVIQMHETDEGIVSSYRKFTALLEDTLVHVILEAESASERKAWAKRILASMNDLAGFIPYLGNILSVVNAIKNIATDAEKASLGRASNRLDEIQSIEVSLKAWSVAAELWRAAVGEVVPIYDQKSVALQLSATSLQGWLSHYAKLRV